MVQSGLDHIKSLQDEDFHEFKISAEGRRTCSWPLRPTSSSPRSTDAPIHLGHHRGRAGS
jgi:(E)-4-hydroxy-3-methylbut-2-enyl-diphosphate synthase